FISIKSNLSMFTVIFYVGLSFLHQFVLKTHHCFPNYVIFLRNVQGSLESLASFYESPTFFQDGFWKQAVLLYAYQNVRYQLLGRFYVPPSYDQDVTPCYLFL